MIYSRRKQLADEIDDWLAREPHDVVLEKSTVNVLSYLDGLGWLRDAPNPETIRYNEFERRLARAEDDGVLYDENPDLFGDLDKPFHRPECECGACNAWRVAQGRLPRRSRRAPNDRRDAADTETLCVPRVGSELDRGFQEGDWGMSMVLCGWQV